MNDSSSFIDINEIIRSRVPRIHRFIPGFVISLLRRIVHEKEVNHLVSLIGNRQGWEAADVILKELNITYKVQGVEKIPIDQPILLVSNHPLGGMDGIVYIHFLGKLFENRIGFIVNSILSYLKMFDNVFIPVNKYGKQKRKEVLAMNSAFESDLPIFTFPAGLVSRLHKEGVSDPVWKSNFVNKTVETERTIIPLLFDGENSSLFYRTAQWRVRLGLRFNYELLLLPSELFKCRNRQFTIKVGTPIAWQTFSNERSPDQWAEWIRKNVYDI